MRRYSELDHTIQRTLGAAIEVHRALGPGLLESAYQRCLMYELGERGIKAVSEISLPIQYKDLQIDNAYKIDILVEDQIVLELKTVESFSDVHIAQILTYMRLGSHPIGYLLNFHVKLMKDGIKRFAL